MCTALRRVHGLIPINALSRKPIEYKRIIAGYIQLSTGM
jgi:hypothetical protein